MQRRQVLRIAHSLGAFWLATRTVSLQARASWHTLVTARPQASNHYSSIGAAIDAAPAHSLSPYRIGIEPGLWHEKLVISKPDIHLIGLDRRRSVLSFDAAAGMPGPDGKPWGTSACASVIVCAAGFRAENLTIENRFDYVGHLYDPVFQPIGSNGLQAVALMLDEGADRAVFTDVDFVGHQDTLFVDQGRSLFRNCRINGSVDFIFGGGRAVFSRCTLLSRFRPGNPRQGYIAAPSTDQSHRGGLLFDRCDLQRESEVSDGSVLLGRAWRPTHRFADGNYGDPDAVGSVLFSRCWMDAHIDKQGWDAMAYTARDGSRQLFEPTDARLYEHHSRGPGALHSEQRRWLSARDPALYDADDLFADWQPES